jgi:ABC-type transporter lipoprotein component MlaA
MKRRDFSQGLALWSVAAGGWVWVPAHAQFTETDAAAGVRAALERGAKAAVALLQQVPTSEL